MHGLAGVMEKYPQLHVTAKGDYILEYDRVCRSQSEEHRESNKMKMGADSLEFIGCT
jgi:hypothetical protein